MVSRKIQELEAQVEQSSFVKELKEKTLNKGRKKSVADLTKQALMGEIAAEDIINAESQLESATKNKRMKKKDTKKII